MCKMMPSTPQLARATGPSAHLGLEVGDVLLCMGRLEAQVPSVHPRGRLSRNSRLHKEFLQDPAQSRLSHLAQQVSVYKANAYGRKRDGKS